MKRGESRKSTREQGNFPNARGMSLQSASRCRERRPALAFSNEPPTHKFTYAVCVRTLASVLESFTSCRGRFNTPAFLTCVSQRAAYTATFRRTTKKFGATKVTSRGTITRNGRAVSRFFSSIEELMTGYAIKMQG